MTPRADVLAVLLRQQRVMDAERREFARRVNEAVRNNIEGHETLDLMAYSRISENLDPIFNDFYGRWPGDVSARFYRLIIDECRRAQALAVRRAVEDVKRRVPAPIWRVIQKEVAA